MVLKLRDIFNLFIQKRGKIFMLIIPTFIYNINFLAYMVTTHVRVKAYVC